MPPLGIRWTIGDVSVAGFEALRLSIACAWNLFGARAQYAVCVNTLPVAAARERIGGLPAELRWLDANRCVPGWLEQGVNGEMAEGVAWKLAPVRVFPHRHELSLDNDVILWALPTPVVDWLRSDEPESCLLAEDVAPALGQFAGMCGDRALNSGIRGLPPGFEMGKRLREMLFESGVVLQSELDEQGLQAAVLLQTRLFTVSTEDVSICSPFPNHQQHLGRCGAHFVGLNQKFLPWLLENRGAHELIRERWNDYSRELAGMSQNTNFSAN